MFSKEHLLKIRENIRKVVENLPDEDAVDTPEMFEPWAIGVTYSVDKRLQHEGVLYKCIQAHTSQADWTPDVSSALFVKVAKPGDGTREHPIAFVWNMVLEEGKYYTQFDVLYICTRDSVIGINADLKDLVGNYVNIITD